MRFGRASSRYDRRACTLTGSQQGERLLSQWEYWSQHFKLVKLKSSDVHALLGHPRRSISIAELRVQAQ